MGLLYIYGKKERCDWCAFAFKTEGKESLLFIGVMECMPMEKDIPPGVKRNIGQYSISITNFVTRFFILGEVILDEPDGKMFWTRIKCSKGRMASWKLKSNTHPLSQTPWLNAPLPYICRSPLTLHMYHLP